MSKFGIKEDIDMDIYRASYILQFTSYMNNNIIVFGSIQTVLLLFTLYDSVRGGN